MTEKTTILVVDDDPTVLRATVRVLRKNTPHEILEASTGTEALEKVRKFRPPLVLLDAVLPDIHGFEVCKTIKSEPGLAGTFVVMVSGTQTTPDDQAEGLRSLADGYIPRPFQNREFLARVEAMLRIQRVEKLLRESETRFRQLFEHSLDGVALHEIVTNRKGEPVDYVFLEVNPKFEELTGLKADNILGKPVTKVVPSAREDGFIEIYGEVALSGKPAQFERFSSSLQRHYDISAYRPRPGRFVTSFSDVTERKEAEQKLKESKEQYQLLVESQGEGIGIVDREENFSFANPAAEEIFGVGKGELEGRNLREFIDQDTLKKILSQTSKRTKGERSSYEMEIIRPDRKPRQILVTATPSFGEKGELTGTFGVFRDITERKRIDRERLESEKRLQTLFEGMPDPVILVDLKTSHVVDVNPAAERLFMRNRDELIGQHRSILHPPRLREDYLKGFKQEMRVARKFGETELHETLVFRADGSEVPVEIVGKIIELEGRTLVQGVFRDISERKRSAEEKKESEERFRTLFQAAPDAILLVDEESGKIVDANPAASVLLQRSREELLDLHNVQLVLESEGAFPESILGTGKSRSRKKVLEDHFLTRPDGSKVWVDLSTSVFRVGSRDMLLAIFRDISERKKAETELRESEERFRVMSSSAQDAIIMMNNKGIVSFWSEAAQRIFGYTEEEALGSPVHELLAPEYYHEAFQLGFPGFVRNGEGGAVGETLELTGKRKSGEEFPVELSLSGVELQGEWNAIGIVRDISERKEAEAKRKLLETGIQQAGEGIVITDTEGFIQYVNPAFQQMTGYTLEEVMDQNPRLLKSGKHDERFYKELWDTLLGGESWRGEFVNKRKDDTLYYERATINPVKDDSGEIVSFIAVKEDITDQKQFDEELRQKNKELEVANKQKSEFVSIVSHDFGNPLGIIMGNVDMMLMGVFGELTPKMKEKLETVRNTTLRLDKLRTDTLELSRMDRGTLELARARQDLVKLVRGAVEGLKLLSREKEQKITLRCPDQLMAEFDRERVYRVLENYLSNAIRYTPEKGKIEIELTQEDSELRFCVKDSGRGIDPSELENIFKPFYRTGKRVKGSTGLGLSIVKGIVEAHGGRCWAESEGEGKGSSFYFTLPLSMK